MDEKTYQKLCDACDRVLLAQDSTIERVAIPWLHIIREHPVFLNNYVDLIVSPKGIRASGHYWHRFFRNGGTWLRQVGRAIRSSDKPWFNAKPLPRQVDVLFVSHLLNKTHAGQTDDFYFGNLPNNLVAQGHSIVIALTNYTDQNEETLIEKWRESCIPRVIFSRTLGIQKEWLFLRRLFRESIRLGKFAGTETDSFVARVALRASEEALSNGALTTLRLGTQIAELARELNPKLIVVTYEGHAWERIAFASARSVVPRVTCIGYQHAALFRLQHGVRRLLSAEYNPDQILTAGSISKAQLAGVPDLTGIPISVLGSNRSIAGMAIGRKKVSDRTNPGMSNELACLVLPEGVADECHLLFEFSLACAQALPEIKFIWRLHPLMSFESVIAKKGKLKILRKNIVLSNATLEEDIGRSHWALYRGSTAVVSTVMAGLRPIYLALPDELTIDPLYELKVFRVKVATVPEFKHVICTEIDAKNEFQKDEFSLAKTYCESFFLPLKIHAFSELIGR